MDIHYFKFEPGKLYDEFNARTVSRVNRGKNEIVQTNAIDFSMRKNLPEDVLMVEGVSLKRNLMD